ncbi:MAG TPA: hypothetical protein VGC41_09800 [Kofleriaceae bacterium]
MFPAPAMPEFPEGQATTATTQLRYEDLTQDGRILPIALPSTQSSLWRNVLDVHPGARNALRTGVIPILTRMIMVSEDQPIHVNRSIEVHAGFQLAHARDATDQVTRLHMNVWTEVRGAAGRIGPSSKPGPLALAGRCFAEHTFTRLMAPPDQRKVTQLAVAGYPDVPELRYTAAPPATAGEPPPGAQWIAALAPDLPYDFTLDQTDSNQHVNSLVYIRIFLDAVNRRLASIGKRGKFRSRAVDVAYRKPSFAGDRVTCHLGLFESADGLGAAGYVAADDGKPRVFIRAAIGT